MLLCATAGTDREEVQFYQERIRDLKWNSKTAEFMEVGLARSKVVLSILGIDIGSIVLVSI